MTASTFRRHAQDVLRQELRRRRGALARLPAERREVVQELAEQTIAACVEGVLEHAREDPLVAAALDSAYGRRPLLAPIPAAPD
jgi:hypothetical protein